MYYQKVKTLTNESGVVLVTVVIMTLVMTILAISLISANVGQTLSAQHQIERIKAEQLAKGSFWYNYMSLATTGSGATAPTEALDRKKYVPSIVSLPGGLNGTTTYKVTVAY